MRAPGTVAHVTCRPPSPRGRLRAASEPRSVSARATRLRCGYPTAMLGVPLLTALLVTASRARGRVRTTGAGSAWTSDSKALPRGLVGERVAVVLRIAQRAGRLLVHHDRSKEHTSELPALMRISY